MSSPASSLMANQSAAELCAALATLVRTLESKRRDEDLTVVQSSVLSILDQGGPATPAALALREQIRPQSMATLLAQLLRRRLISRSADPSDRRQVLVTITESGKQALQAEREERVRQLARAMLLAFTPVELGQFGKAIPLLERLGEFV